MSRQCYSGVASRRQKQNDGANCDDHAGRYEAITVDVNVCEPKLIARELDSAYRDIEAKASRR